MQRISGTVSTVPAVVSPLNVVLRRGKPRLVLDRPYVNSFIDTSGLKFKYEQKLGLSGSAAQ